MKQTPDLSQLILPSEIFEHFELIATLTDDHAIHIHLDQKNTPPVKHNYTYTSKGFSDPTVVQDFPIRGVPVLLHIRRRKWLEQPSGQIVTSHFELTHLGTQLSPEFAAFLKEVYRQ